MKGRSFLAIIVSVVLLFFASCEQEKTPVISSTSENGEIQVNVQGSRYMSTDPYMVDIVAITKFDTLNASVEAASDAIDESTVEFEWEGNNKCFVYITQRDGQVITVPISIQY